MKAYTYCCLVAVYCLDSQAMDPVELQQYNKSGFL